MNWKEHPLRVAIVAVVATSLFFMTVVLPIWLKSTEEELKTFRKDAKEYEKERQEVSRLRLELAVLKSQNPFTGGDPYPLGFRLVRLGDDLRVLEGIYDKERIHWKDDWVNVDLDDPLFRGLAYHYKLKDGRKLAGAVQLLFKQMDGQPYEIVKRYALETFGRGSFRETVRNQRRQFTVKNVRGVDLVVEETGGVSVWVAGQYPY